MTAVEATGNGTSLVAPRKLALACGQNKPEGWFGIDISADCDADLVCDLLRFPWPVKSNSVRELQAFHFVEHIPHWRPWFTKDGWFHFFDEVYRVCRKDAVCTFVVPFVKNSRAFWDPTHERFIDWVTWHYLSKEWREFQKLDHYPTNHDFEVVTVDGMGGTEGFQTRSDEQQMHMREHYWDCVADLKVILRVIK